MLNELRELDLCLQNAGISRVDLHKNFKPCRKNGITCWVYIDSEGSISDIAVVPSKEVTAVRKWEKAAGISFPAFNVPPLLVVKAELNEAMKKMKKAVKSGKLTEEDIAALSGKAEWLWNDGDKVRIEDCISRPIVDMGSFLISSNNQTSLKPFTELCSRVKKIKITDFQNQFGAKLQNSLLKSPDEKIFDTLFVSADEDGFVNREGKSIQVILELAEWEPFKYQATHRVVQQAMNACFMALPAANYSAPVALDAYGLDEKGNEEKFPPASLPILGSVILRAMNSESPCQKRYGMIDAGSFPAGAEVRKGLKSALEWIGAPERKGKTWSDLSKRMGRSMLLFAYPSEIPDEVDALAGMMGEPNETDTDADPAVFEAFAQKVTTALQGRIRDAAECEIRVFVLAKMDKARTKVLASHRYSAAHVIRSAQNWQDGCRNLPRIKVRCFGNKKGERTVLNDLMIPFPAEIAWCLNTVWMAGRDDKGERYGYAKGAHGFDINDSLTLLLGTQNELRQVTERALGALIRNSAPLLLAIGQASARGRVYPTDRKYSKQTLLLPSIIGLLLNKLGYTKGGIMASPAFLVGRFLSLADSLHLEYCKTVRNNSIPPQLVGNALMATAQEEPTKALSVMWGRIKPYHAWAQALKDGERVRLVKYFLSQFGEVSNQLAEIALPQRCSDADKAQMLLGYLSRPETENEQ